MIQPDDLLSTQTACQLLGGISDRTLRRYRTEYWHESVHYLKPVRKIQYIKPMILHWMLHRQTNPQAHQKAIEDWITEQNRRNRKNR